MEKANKTEKKEEIEIKLPPKEKVISFLSSPKLQYLFLFLVVFISFYVRISTFNQPHLLAADPFHWHRFVKWIVEGNVPEHDYLWTFPEFPKFKATISPLLVPLTAYSYLLIGKYFFDVEKWCFLIPAILSALCAIPIFFLVRALKNWIAGIFASLFFCLSPAFLARSMAGFFDTDALNMLLSATIICLFIIAYLKVDEKKPFDKKPLFLSFLAGIFLVLFNLQWYGWWYIFYLLLAVFVLHSLYIFIISKKRAKSFVYSHLYIYLTFFLTFFIFILLIRGPTYIFGIVRAPLTMIPGTEQYFWRTSTVFPNVWISISEEQRPNNILQEVFFRIGILSFLLGVIGLFLLTYSFIFSIVKEKRRGLTKYEVPFFLLILWIAATYYASLQAVRFAMLMAMPFSILAGLVFGYVWDFIFFVNKKVKNYKKNPFIAALLSFFLPGMGQVYNKRYMEAVFFLSITFTIDLLIFIFEMHYFWLYLFMLLIILISTWMAYASSKDTLSEKPNNSAIGIALFIFFSFFSLKCFALVYAMAIPFEHYSTGISKNWEEGFMWIKENTPNCSLIATYWDPGFWIQDLAERPVVFDGGSQRATRKTPLNKLYGLDCVKDRKGIVDEENNVCITARIRDISTCLYTDNETLCAKILKSYLPDENDTLYKKYYDDCKPKVYFLASSDLLGKSHWWTMFATWNVEKGGGEPIDYITSTFWFFEKAELQNGIAIFFKPFPMQKGIYASYTLLLKTENNSSSIEPYLTLFRMTSTGGLSPLKYVKIGELRTFLNNTIVKLNYENAEIEGGYLYVSPYAFYLLSKGNFNENEWRKLFVVYVPERLKDSLFTRMMLFEGYGLKHFKQVYSNPDFKLYELVY